MQNRLNHIITLSMLLLCLYSCEEPIGKWDDNIKLSAKKADFKANGDSIIIKTGGSWWWINNIMINKNPVWYPRPETADSTHYTVNLDSVAIKRQDAKTLFIKVNKNNLKSQREISINLEAGDYFDYVTITQKGQ